MRSRGLLTERAIPPTPGEGRIRSGMRKGLFVVAAAVCLTPWITPPLALTLGASLALAAGNPFSRASHKVSRYLLQACVVMLGFGMNLPVVLRAGADGAAFAAGTIAVALALGWLFGKLLRINRGTTVLISAGTAICGGSAIAAVGSAIDADEGDMTVAMGVVFLLNGAALYLFPLLGHALEMTNHQFGTWAGVAIHDVSSVVGAAGRYGLDALQTATAVKLSRALWIVPLTLASAIILNRQNRVRAASATIGFDAAQQKTPNRIQIPWFIGLFLLASVCRSFVPGVEAAAGELTQFATAGLTLTLFLIGAGLSARTLRAVGWRALLQGALIWAFIAAASLIVVLKLG
ncbi:MAG TPA: putative sulfate exporter family transporter [Pirellulales bacterium]